MGEPTVSVPRVPTEPGWWWRRYHSSNMLIEVKRSPFGGSLLAHENTHMSIVNDDGRWIAPVLTTAEVAALTAERDEARECAEIAAAAENANAAELREARATLDAVAALVDGGDVVDRVRELVALEQRLDAVERAGYV